jgi:hypothetical protein
MKRTIAALALAIASVGSHAGTYEISITDVSWQVLDLNPGNAFTPSYTVTSGDLLRLLSPVEIHDAWGEFEEGTVMPPNVGGHSFVKGMIAPDTQLIWKVKGHFRASVIDVGDPDEEFVEIKTAFYSTDVGLGYNGGELNVGLNGGGGTYDRIVEEYDFDFELRATNWEGDVARPYEIGWFNQYLYQSHRYSNVPPVPEPSTYALALAGLGLLMLRLRGKGRA